MSDALTGAGGGEVVVPVTFAVEVLEQIRSEAGWYGFRLVSDEHGGETLMVETSWSDSAEYTHPPHSETVRVSNQRAAIREACEKEIWNGYSTCSETVGLEYIDVIHLIDDLAVARAEVAEVRELIRVADDQLRRAQTFPAGTYAWAEWVKRARESLAEQVSEPCDNLSPGLGPKTLQSGAARSAASKPSTEETRSRATGVDPR